MTRKLSFSRVERDILPQFRNKINKSESTQDVRKVFSHTLGILLKDILSEDMSLRADDILLDPETTPHFKLSQKLQNDETFGSIWRASDLPHVCERLAESAVHRFRHLETHPEKTEAKIRM